MKALQVKFNTEDTYNSAMSSTDGIYLRNISGDQLDHVIKYLYFIDDPIANKFTFSTDFNQLMTLFETSEYLAIDKMKIDLL